MSHITMLLHGTHHNVVCRPTDFLAKFLVLLKNLKLPVMLWSVHKRHHRRCVSDDLDYLKQRVVIGSGKFAGFARVTPLFVIGRIAAGLIIDSLWWWWCQYVYD